MPEIVFDFFEEHALRATLLILIAVVFILNLGVWLLVINISALDVKNGLPRICYWDFLPVRHTFSL
jgi:hypothetical protein